MEWHLNYSLSGEYVNKAIKENRDKNLDIEEIMNNVYQHVGSIDYHDPFEDKENFGYHKISSS